MVYPGAWWFHLDRSSSVSLCACGSASGMRDCGRVAPSSYILQGAVLRVWVCERGGGGGLPTVLGIGGT